jgi:hypothetical protein
MTTEALTKITAYMTPDAMTALESAADRLGLSRTDTLNRAVQAYETLLAAEPGAVLVFPNPDGTSITVRIGR